MALAAMIFLGGRKEAAKRNVSFLVVVVSSQENIYSLVDDKNHQEICICSFPGGFARPPRKLSILLAFILGIQGMMYFLGGWQPKKCLLWICLAYFHLNICKCLYLVNFTHTHMAL
jgi:hypothetical protein